MTRGHGQLADLEARIAEAERRGERLRAELGRVRVRETSVDGEISVLVNHSGHLVDLTIGDAARQRPDLSEQILHMVRRAQSRLAVAVLREVPSIAGTDTMAELMHQLRRTFPPPEERT